MVIQILHIVRCLWAEERQSLCKSLLSIHCNRPSAHLLSVEDIFLLSWQDAFNQESARAMPFPLLWYQSLFCGVCLVWWFTWSGMYGTYLIAKDQLYLDKACRWVPLASTCLPLGYHKGVQGEPVNLAREQRLELLLLLHHLWHTGRRSVGGYQE